MIHDDLSRVVSCYRQLKEKKQTNQKNPKTRTTPQQGQKNPHTSFSLEHYLLLLLTFSERKDKSHTTMEYVIPQVS